MIVKHSLCFSQITTILSFFLFLSIMQSINAQVQVSSACPETCQICTQSSSYCTACKLNYQLSHIGACVRQQFVNNCNLYGLRDSCMSCRPTFRLSVTGANVCQKMYDGCAVAGTNGMCAKCLDGSLRNQMGQCDNKFLHCFKLNSNAQCIFCQMGYRLLNGRCVNDDPNCLLYENTNGLCTQCLFNYKLIQYRCIPLNEGENCYIISQDFQTCSYCKTGYDSFYGKCYVKKVIDSLLGLGELNGFGGCTSTQYYDSRSKLCYPLPQYCQKFDYGFMRCIFCVNTFVVINNLCRDPLLRYCEKFDSINPYACATCQSRFFLTSQKMCKQYPAFCELVVNKKCTKCSASFLLNSKGICQDPNCEISDSSTSECLKCRNSYLKNMVSGICIFDDPNCLQKYSNNSCKTCRQDYIKSSQSNLCKFVDPFCKIFSEKELCLQCVIGYFLHDITKICTQLPYKCLIADYLGCKFCAESYTLQSNRECSKYMNISNCQQVSEVNNICQKCKEGYYLKGGISGLCIELPVFCEQFDLSKLLCKKCAQGSEMRNGICFDNLCQYFGDGGECLGCKAGYSYGRRGECIEDVSDINCKQFLFGQCRLCSDRYYFNSLWRCVSVSTLCRQYNMNNGDCSACYAGYGLEEGKCVRESDYSQCQIFVNVGGGGAVCNKCKDGFKVTAVGGCQYAIGGCLQRNFGNSSCNRCKQGYLLDQNNGYCLKTNSSSLPVETPVEAQPQPSYLDKNCLQYSSDGKSCQKCVSRMFFSQSKVICEEVDRNCKIYKEVTGQCTQCYSGYQLGDNNQCVVGGVGDLNCKKYVDKACEECYSGYYFDKLVGFCVVVDSLCKEVNLVNGKCLSCWGGYNLVNGRCIIEGVTNSSTTPNVQRNNSRNSTVNENKNGSVNMSSNKGQEQTEMMSLKDSNMSDAKTLRDNNTIQISNANINNTNNDQNINDVDVKCSKWNKQENKCDKCLEGYSLDLTTKTCFIVQGLVDPDCLEYRDGQCSKCSQKKLVEGKCQ